MTLFCVISPNLVASRVYCVKVYMHDVIIQKFTFAISSPGEFLVSSSGQYKLAAYFLLTISLLVIMHCHWFQCRNENAGLLTHCRRNLHLVCE